MPHFVVEEVPGDHPHLVCTENGVRMVVYFGCPPGRPQGVWIAFGVPNSPFVYMHLAHELGQFELAALEAVAHDIILQ